MIKVAVLLSTYNGEKFIREQISSILAQKYDEKLVQFEIYCRDDGSTDRTLEILKEFHSKYENFFLLHKGKNIENYGVKLSFYLLLQQVKADYYFFCDQDDIWYPDKVETFLKKFFLYNSKVPCGIYSDLDLVKSDGQSLNCTMMQANKWDYDEKRNLPFLIFKSRVTGAAFAINKVARAYVLRVPMKQFAKIYMHDSFIALLIAAYDNLHFIPRATVMYRQHKNNVLGAIPDKQPLFTIKNRVDEVNQFFKDFRILKATINLSELTIDNKKVFDAIDRYVKQRNVSDRIKTIIKDYHIVWDTLDFKRLLFLVFLYEKR